MRDMLASHLSDEAGAVAVDWVVLTAGLVGLGLAASSVVSRGIEDLSGDISTQLGATPLRSTFWDRGIEAFFDFSDGLAPGWIGGQVINMGGAIGEVLVIAGNQSVGYSVQVPSGANQAVLTFDLIAGDSLDQERATISLNGTTVAIGVSQWGGDTRFEIPQIDGTTVNATVSLQSGSHGGTSHWPDSISQVTITVDQPTGNLEFQVHSNADQDVRDEYWGIDNFEALAE
jgi:hypothetical protein